MRVQLDNFGRYSALSENEDEDPGLHDDDGTPPPPPPPVSDGPPAPLDIWQTVFYGLAFTSAVGSICGTIISDFDLSKPGLATLALFSVYLPCFFQYLLQVCVLALPKTHEPLRDVVSYLWELLNVAFMCMAAANVPACTRAFLLDDPEQDISQCSTFSYLMFALRGLTFIFYVLYRWTHNLTKREQFDVSVPHKANTAYLVTRGLIILLIGLLWLLNGLLQSFKVYDKPSFIGTWWAVIILDIFLVHLGLVTSFAGKIFGRSKLFHVTSLLGAFNLFFGSVLASYIIAATLFSPGNSTSYILSGLVVCIAFLLAPTYNANFLRGWFQHKRNRLAEISVGCLWALAHIFLFVSIIASGSFYMIAMNRDLDVLERWYMCASYTAGIISLAVISHADVISFYNHSGRMIRIAQHHPTRVAYMQQPLNQFMTPEEMAALHPRRLSAWGSFILSLILRATLAGCILFLPFIPVDKMPLWSLFLAIALVSLLYSLCAPIYVGYLISLCRKGTSSRLHLRWLYAIRHEKIRIVHRSDASILGLPLPASASDSDSE